MSLCLLLGLEPTVEILGEVVLRPQFSPEELEMCEMTIRYELEEEMETGIKLKWGNNFLYTLTPIGRGSWMLLECGGLN